MGLFDKRDEGKPGGSDAYMSNYFQGPETQQELRRITGQYITTSQRQPTVGTRKREAEYDPVVMGDWQVKPEAVSPENTQGNRIYKQDVLNARTQFALSNAPYQERKKQYDEALALAQQKRQFGNFGFVTAPKAEEATVAHPPAQQSTGGAENTATTEQEQAATSNPTWRGMDTAAGGRMIVDRPQAEGDQNIYRAVDDQGGTAVARWNSGSNPFQAQRTQQGLGFNADMAQQAVNQYGGVGSVRQVQGRPDLYAVRGNAGSYGFQGSADAAALFGAPVFNSAHRVQDGPNETFLRYRAEERARRAAPQQEEQELMGWVRRDKQRERESRERIAAQQAQLGYDTDASKNALTREQLAQQYGFNMAQAGNDALRTQAALGVSGLQQRRAMAQMEAFERWRNAKTPEERARAAQEIQLLSGSNQKENEREPKPDYQKLKDEMGNERLVRVEGDTYTPLTQAGQGRGLGEGDFKTPQIIAVYNAMPDEMKKRFDSAENDEARGKVLDEGFAWIKAQGKKK